MEDSKYAEAKGGQVTDVYDDEEENVRNDNNTHYVDRHVEKSLVLRQDLLVLPILGMYVSLNCKVLRRICLMYQTQFSPNLSHPHS